MLDRDRALEWCRAALDASKADACEVTLGGGNDAWTRFAANEVHQSMASESYEISVRSLLGRRTGRASTTRLDADGIRAAVETSERAARLAPESADVLSLAGPQAYRPVPGAYDDATARLDAGARADAAAEFIDAARAKNLVAAGFVRTVCGRVGDYGERGAVAIVNSSGLEAFHAGTTFQVSATVMGKDGSGWVEGTGRSAGQVDVPALAGRAADKAAAAQSLQAIAPGSYTVLLEPAAVADLLAFLTPEFAATVVDEGRSCLSERFGTPLFAPSLRLWDDPYHALHQSTPFDAEGWPTDAVLLVEAGAARRMVYDRASAARHGVAPTGHGLRVPSPDGAAASHLVLEGGDGTAADLAAGVERGLLVTRLWYSRVVEARDLVVTGMTRDGTYWIEEGRVRHAVLNLRFNQSVLEVLRNVRALGRPEATNLAVAPPLVADGFRFTSATRF